MIPFIEALGFRPTTKRLNLIIQGFLLTVIFMTLYYLLESAVWRSPYHFNPDFSVKGFLLSILSVLASALFQELLFRGLILYLLTRYLGEKKAVLISAVLFGAYHWIIVGIHSIPQMTLLFFSMAWMGYALAYSFIVSGSILIPLALHFASNFVGADIFGDSTQLLIHAPGTRPSGIILLLMVAIHNFAYPLIVLGWLQYVKKRKL